MRTGKYSLLRYLILTVICLLMFAGTALAAEISGCAYIDLNENGICDVTDSLITGVPLTIDRKENGEWCPYYDLVTDEYGQYLQSDISSGTWRIRCTMGVQEVYAASVGGSDIREAGFAVSSEIDLKDYDCAAKTDIQLVSSIKSNFSAYVDANANSMLDKNEKPLAGVVFSAFEGDTLIASCATDIYGRCTLLLPSETLRLTVALPDGYAFMPAGEMNGTDLSDEGKYICESFVPYSDSRDTFFCAARSVGSLSGMAFEDLNNNGILDEGEPGVAGVAVHISGKRSAVLQTIVTDETGLYTFLRLPDDIYTVTADLPDGMLFARYSKTGGDLRSIFSGATREREYVIKKAAKLESRHIGVVQKGAIIGTAFLDLNYNGVRDEDEPAYAGVTVEVIKVSSGDSMGKAVTDKNGNYRVENLRGGDYRVRAILPDDGSIFSLAVAGDPSKVNCFVQRFSRRENTVQPITIGSGEEKTVLIGVARGASISGVVFEDADYSGTYNGKERMLSGLKVIAYDAQGNEAASAITNGKGRYTLGGILPGNYTLRFQRKAGYGFTKLRPQLAKGSYVTQLVGEFGITEPIDISMGDAIMDVNAGMLPSSTVSGSFFHDSNDNGLWDDGETGLVSGMVLLDSEDDEIHLVASPDTNGEYFFDGVMPGKYTLTFIPGSDAEMAHNVTGGNTVSNDKPEIRFQIKMGENYAAETAGGVILGSFCGTVWADHNGNGRIDSGEQALAGARILMKGINGSCDETASDTDGHFEIRGLRPQEYSVQTVLPSGYIFSCDPMGLAFGNCSASESICPWDVLVSRKDILIGAVRPASLSGQIWMDEDMSGDRSETEWIFSGLEMILTSDGGNVLKTVTDENGFIFGSVRPGTYCIEFEMPFQSSPAGELGAAFALNGSQMKAGPFTVDEGEQVAGINSGLVSRTSIGGRAMIHEYDSDLPVAGMKICLYKDADNAPAAVTATDENGSYRFDGLWPAQYRIGAQLADGMVFIHPDDPDFAAGSSDIMNTVNGVGNGKAFLLQMARDQLEHNVVCIRPGKVGDMAWLDTNGNGLVDSGEPYLCGITVSLIQNERTVYSVKTDARGYYLMNDVYPGEYILKSEACEQLVPTISVPELRIISSCLVEGNGTEAFSNSFRVESGEICRNYDIGYVLKDGESLPDEYLQLEPVRHNWEEVYLKTK